MLKNKNNYVCIYYAVYLKKCIYIEIVNCKAETCK